MSEKVKLPKTVCDALDLAINKYQRKHSEIIYLMIRKAFYNVDSRLTFMQDEDAETIMRALVLGYEPELTPEERIKERYKNGFRGDSQGIFRAGIREALQIHGIKYDWLEGAE